MTGTPLGQLSGQSVVTQPYTWKRYIDRGVNRFDQSVYDAYNVDILSFSGYFGPESKLFSELHAQALEQSH